jgi:hypothetical protein
VFDLLAYLIKNRDRVVSKDDLVAAIWGGRIVSESALTTRINATRCAIGDIGSNRNDQAHRSRRIGFCPCDSRHRRESGSARCQMQKSTAQKFCCFHPQRMAMQHDRLDWTTLRPPAFRYYRRGFNSALAALANAHESLLSLYDLLLVINGNAEQAGNAGGHRRAVSLRNPACPQSGPPHSFRRSIHACFRRRRFPAIRPRRADKLWSPTRAS